jgi:hypothetical protein
MTLVIDALVAAAGGFIATKAMEPVTTVLYEHESEADRERERRVSPGVPYRVAAENVTRAVGLRLSERQLDRAGLLLHYGLGVGRAPLYPLLRRRWRLADPLAGVASGLALFVVVDEGLNPILGSSAAPQAYLVASHLRGLVGHLTYGLALAAAVEAAWLLLGRRERR